MAYSLTNSKGDTYYLHGKKIVLRNGRSQQIYYFARDIRAEALDSIPAGFEAVETKRTGMPVLRKV